MPNAKVDKTASPRLTLIATSLGFALIILDVTVVNVALERIKASLETDVTGLQWVINAYTLAFASLLLTAGALGDRFGAKRIFISGFALFAVASLVCGLAGRITVLIAGRIAQGVGAALCVPASLALVSASFPDAATRAWAVSIWAGVGGLALAAGPVVGGVMVDRFGWPSIFFLNLRDMSLFDFELGHHKGSRTVILPETMFSDSLEEFARPLLAGEKRSAPLEFWCFASVDRPRETERQLRAAGLRCG